MTKTNVCTLAKLCHVWDKVPHTNGIGCEFYRTDTDHVVNSRNYRCPMPVELVLSNLREVELGDDE